MKFFFIILVVFFSSCSLFDGLRKRSFVYKEDGTDHHLSVLVPKGYKKVNVTIDSAGNKIKRYTYSDGAFLYFFHGDSTKEIQAIDTAMNIAKFYPGNTKYYKGQDSSNGLFWRESGYKNLRFGYKNINHDVEARFDSAVNYASWQQIKKQ